MTMDRQRRRGLSTTAARACVPLLLAGLAGCGSNAEDARTEPFAEGSQHSELPSAASTLEVAEPPWETDLTLSTAEKKAVDEAHEALVNYFDALAVVTDEGGANPERALQYTTGEIAESAERYFERFRNNSERTSGRIRHRSHELVDIELVTDGRSRTTATFHSCTDPSDYDLLDSSGESLKKVDVSPYYFTHVFEQTDDGWKYAQAENPDEPCR